MFQRAAIRGNGQRVVDDSDDELPFIRRTRRHLNRELRKVASSDSDPEITPLTSRNNRVQQRKSPKVRPSRRVQRAPSTVGITIILLTNKNKFNKKCLLLKIKV